MNRPGWDDYFLGIAVAVSARGECVRRQVGAVIVKDHHSVGQGYNGAPAGDPNCLDGHCPRGLHWPKRDVAGVPYCACGEYDWPCPHASEPGKNYDNCIAVHAEANALLDAADKGTNVRGGTIYITAEPCFGCLKLVRGAGIIRVVVKDYGEYYRES